jgi:hypothetical protein
MTLVLHHQTIEANQSLSGKDLAEWFEDLHTGGRAVMALSLMADGATITDLSPVQAASLAGVGLYAVALAAIATPDERSGLMRGNLRLSDVRKAHARKQSDADIVAFINRDPDRVLAVLDQMTAPAPTTTTTDPVTTQLAMAAE